MNYLAPSVLSADFSMLGKEIETIAKAGAGVNHLDVMDGNFVPNLSFGAPVIASVRKSTEAIFDVHLMIDEPIRYLEDFKKAGADIITIHYEACKDVELTLNEIKKLGVKAGLAISPDTPVDVIKPFLEIVDMVLVMSVYPGFGGQSFIEGSLDKIKAVKEMICDINREIWLEVDGGIGAANIETVMQAGANVLVAGSAVFKGNRVENVKELSKIIAD